MQNQSVHVIILSFEFDISVLILSLHSFIYFIHFIYHFIHHATYNNFSYHNYLDEEECSSDATSTSTAGTDTVYIPPRGTFSYILVGDNVDKLVHPRYMTTENQSKSLHYFHTYAALDRIDFHHLDNDKPIANVSSLPLSTFLPNTDDCAALRTNYAILLGRELVKGLPFFEQYKDYIPAHIKHQHSEAMSMQSIVVSLCTV